MYAMLDNFYHTVKAQNGMITATFETAAAIRLLIRSNKDGKYSIYCRLCKKVCCNASFKTLVFIGEEESSKLLSEIIDRQRVTVNTAVQEDFLSGDNPALEL